LRILHEVIMYALRPLVLVTLLGVGTACTSEPDDTPVDTDVDSDSDSDTDPAVASCQTCHQSEDELKAHLDTDVDTDPVDEGES
jgi:hypothetical protein